MQFITRQVSVSLYSLSFLIYVAGPAFTQQAEPEIEPTALPESVTNDIGMQFVLIPAGEFLMGSPTSEKDRSDDEAQHRVRISRPFYLQTTEVTQRQWKATMGTEPWQGKDFIKQGNDYAASYVNWDDAAEFCKTLTIRDGVSHRLPTEAEWEYACRGGSGSSYSFGDNVSDLSEYGWYDGNADRVGERYAHIVGSKKANGYGLFDMHGNVWEWCLDWHDKDYYDISPSSDPQGPSKGLDRVYRGGSWLNHPPNCRSAYRDWRTPDFRRYHVGFRVLRCSVK